MQNCYLRFCRDASYVVVPASESVLYHFVSHLAHQNLKHKTIKVYLHVSAICFLHIVERAEDPFHPSRLQLEYVLSGIKRVEAKRSANGKQRLPISPNILRKVKAMWEGPTSDPDTVMLWAACCLMIFGFLRTGELTVPSDKAYDPLVHLNQSDIAVDNPSQPTVIWVTIKHSRTGPFQKGLNLFWGRTSSELFPVVAMLNYLLVRGPQEGPLFKYKDGHYLTRQRFIVAVEKLLRGSKSISEKYFQHSFRIKEATTAVTKGMEDSLIETLRDVCNGAVPFTTTNSLLAVDSILFVAMEPQPTMNQVATAYVVRLPRDQLASCSRVFCA